jgi:gamma-glutamyl-gamma-aminobutyrate hydrolase PuuD
MLLRGTAEGSISVEKEVPILTNCRGCKTVKVFVNSTGVWSLPFKLETDCFSTSKPVELTGTLCVILLS